MFHGLTGGGFLGTPHSDLFNTEINNTFEIYQNATRQSLNAATNPPLPAGPANNTFSEAMAANSGPHHAAITVDKLY